MTSFWTGTPAFSARALRSLALARAGFLVLLVAGLEVSTGRASFSCSTALAVGITGSTAWGYGERLWGSKHVPPFVTYPESVRRSRAAFQRWQPLLAVSSLRGALIAEIAFGQPFWHFGLLASLVAALTATAIIALRLQLTPGRAGSRVPVEWFKTCLEGVMYFCGAWA